MEDLAFARWCEEIRAHEEIRKHVDVDAHWKMLSPTLSGATFESTWRTTGQRCVVKVERKEGTPQWSDLLEREWTVWERIHRHAQDHPEMQRHFPTLFAYGAVKEFHYMIQQHAGVDLYVVFSAEQSFVPAAQRIDWVQQLVRIVHFLHAQCNLAHCDVSAENITYHEETSSLMLLDVASAMLHPYKANPIRLPINEACGVRNIMVRPSTSINTKEDAAHLWIAADSVVAPCNGAVSIPGKEGWISKEMLDLCWRSTCENVCMYENDRWMLGCLVFLVWFHGPACQKAGTKLAEYVVTDQFRTSVLLQGKTKRGECVVRYGKARGNWIVPFEHTDFFWASLDLLRAADKRVSLASLLEKTPSVSTE